MVSAIAGAAARAWVCRPTPLSAFNCRNIVENILTILGVLRAGMIAAPLPLLWRRADAVAALARAGAKALITCGHVGDFDHGQFAMRVAAEVFSIRYVCGFGDDLPDGVVPFDDLFDRRRTRSGAAARSRRTIAAAHLAVITFDVGEDGPVPVARSHLELLAGGLGVLLESRLGAGRDHPVDDRARLVCRHLPDAGAVAALPAARWCCIIRSIARLSRANGATSAAAR